MRDLGGAAKTAEGECRPGAGTVFRQITSSLRSEEECPLRKDRGRDGLGDKESIVVSLR